jgi:hypothetical protein
MASGLAPSSQTVESLLRAPGKASQKNWQIYFNGKTYSTTFDQTHLSKSKFDKVGLYPGKDKHALP